MLQIWHENDTRLTQISDDIIFKNEIFFFFVLLLPFVNFVICLLSHNETSILQFFAL